MLNCEGWHCVSAVLALAVALVPIQGTSNTTDEQFWPNVLAPFIASPPVLLFVILFFIFQLVPLSLNRRCLKLHCLRQFIWFFFSRLPLEPHRTLYNLCLSTSKHLSTDLKLSLCGGLYFVKMLFVQINQILFSGFFFFQVTNPPLAE